MYSLEGEAEKEDKNRRFWLIETSISPPSSQASKIMRLILTVFLFQGGPELPRPELHGVVLLRLFDGVGHGPREPFHKVDVVIVTFASRVVALDAAEALLQLLVCDEAWMREKEIVCVFGGG